jgi:hypothetical protein
MEPSPKKTFRKIDTTKEDLVNLAHLTKVWWQRYTFEYLDRGWSKDELLLRLCRMNDEFYDLLTVLDTVMFLFEQTGVLTGSIVLAEPIFQVFSDMLSHPVEARTFPHYRPEDVEAYIRPMEPDLLRIRQAFKDSVVFDNEAPTSDYPTIPLQPVSTRFKN